MRDIVREGARSLTANGPAQGHASIANDDTDCIRVPTQCKRYRVMDIVVQGLIALILVALVLVAFVPVLRVAIFLVASVAPVVVAIVAILITRMLGE